MRIITRSKGMCFYMQPEDVHIDSDVNSEGALSDSDVYFDRKNCVKIDL